MGKKLDGWKKKWLKKEGKVAASNYKKDKFHPQLQKKVSLIGSVEWHKAFHNHLERFATQIICSKVTPMDVGQQQEENLKSQWSQSWQKLIPSQGDGLMARGCLDGK